MSEKFNPENYTLTKDHLVRDHRGDMTTIKSTTSITADENAENNDIVSLAENEYLKVSFESAIESAIHLDGDQDEYIYELFANYTKIEFKRDLNRKPLTYHEIKMLNMLINQLQRTIIDMIKTYRENIKHIDGKI